MTYISITKVCGFLTEIVAEENTVSSIICGIGINIKPSNEISKPPLPQVYLEN